MINYLALGVAILLSAVAAYYSIAGLIAIFAAAVIPIAIMGTSLEIAKLVAASWIYRNWNTAPVTIKYYLISAVFVLMIITSLGTFGYLSKAHLDQGMDTGDVQAQLNIFDEKIAIQQELISQSRKDISILNNQIEKLSELGAVSRGIKARDQQANERQQLLNSIDTAQKAITALREERAPIAASLRKIEAEVGPIKYIADLIYGDANSDLLEKAVRVVIIMIVLVFDPLAVVLLIAANYGLSKPMSRPVGRPKQKKEPTWVKRIKTYKSKRDPSKVEIDRRKIKNIEDGGIF
jgi:DNA-binding MarR family transcriptional regulator